MNNTNSGNNINNIIPHDSSLRGYSVENSFYDSPYNMDFEYGYLNLMFNITAFTARTQDMYQSLESNLSGIIELQSERRRLEFESRQVREAREARENNQNSNIPLSAPSTSQESRQNIFTPRPTSSTTNPTSPNDNLNSLFGTRNVFLGFNPTALYNNSATTGANTSRVFRRNRNGLTIQEIEENTEIINYNSISPEQILNTECPISRDVFNTNSVVLRLKECSHCFVPFRMMTWLESHSTCPLCRRNVIPITTSEPTPIIPSPDHPTTETTTSSSNSFSNILNNLRNSTNLSNLSIDNMNDDSLVFSFDLPRSTYTDREFYNSYLSSMSQVFSNLNTNTTNTTNTTTTNTGINSETTETGETNDTSENNHTTTTSEHDYDEVD
jgi:hypothetical protein